MKALRAVRASEVQKYVNFDVIFRDLQKIISVDDLVLVMIWWAQALRKCILSWVSGLQSLRYIQNKMKKTKNKSKNEVGGALKVPLKLPPNLIFRYFLQFILDVPKTLQVAYPA